MSKAMLSIVLWNANFRFSLFSLFIASRVLYVSVCLLCLGSGCITGFVHVWKSFNILKINTSVTFFFLCCVVLLVLRPLGLRVLEVTVCWYGQVFRQRFWHIQNCVRQIKTCRCGLILSWDSIWNVYNFTWYKI